MKVLARCYLKGKVGGVNGIVTYTKSFGTVPFNIAVLASNIQLNL